MLKRTLAERWSVTWPMAALCLLGGSRWLLEGARPAAQSTYTSEALGALGAAGTLALQDLWSKRTMDGSRPVLESAELPKAARVLGGVCAFCGTALAATISRRAVHADDATLALAITPCVVAVAGASLGRAAGVEMTARLWPGLAALAGLLLLLPQPRLGDWRLVLALAAMPLITGIGAAAFLEEPAGTEPPGAPRTVARFALLGTACVYACLGWFRESSTGIWRLSSVTGEAVALDGLTALLAVITLLRLGPMRWSANFILVPFVALLEGVAFLRPELDTRSWLAFALLLISGAYLFVPDGPATGVSIR